MIILRPGGFRWNCKKVRTGLTDSSRLLKSCTEENPGRKTRKKIHAPCCPEHGNECRRRMLLHFVRPPKVNLDTCAPNRPAPVITLPVTAYRTASWQKPFEFSRLCRTSPILRQTLFPGARAASLQQTGSATWLFRFRLGSKMLLDCHQITYSCRRNAHVARKLRWRGGRNRTSFRISKHSVLCKSEP